MVLERFSSLQVWIQQFKAMLSSRKSRISAILKTKSGGFRIPYQRVIPPGLRSLPNQIQKIQNIPPLSLSLSQPASSGQSISSSYPPFLPAAGLTRRLLAALSEEKTLIPHGAIAAWCVEGDNRGDARSFANVVLDVLDLRK